MPLKISYSSASKFKQCPQKYYYSKTYNTVEKSSALFFGSAVEEGVTELITSGDLVRASNMFARHWQFERGSTRNPVLDNPNVKYYTSDLELELVELSSAWATKAKEELLPDTLVAWDDAFKIAQKAVEEKTATDEQKAYVNRIFWYSCLQRGHMMLAAFQEDILPLIEDVVQIRGKPGVQYKVEMEDGSGNSIDGYIDYVLYLKGHKKPFILDCKTAGQPYDIHKLISSEQLRTYAAALQEDLGECGVGYMVLLKKIKYSKTCPECNDGKDWGGNFKKCNIHKTTLERTAKAGTQFLTHSYAPHELDSVLLDYENVLSAIEHEVNFKNADQCMAYGSPCEFYDLCWKNKTPEEIPNLTIKPPKGN